MIFLKKITFFFVVLYSFISCGTEDIVGNVLTGGLYGVAKGISNINEPCKAGLSSCDNGNGIAHIKEVNTTIYVDPKDLNTTPSLIVADSELVLNVGEQYNVFLTVSDQDLDDVTVTALVKKPSIASVEVLEAPDRLLITALASGTTFAKAYGKDDDNHVGESQNIKIVVLGGDANDTPKKAHAVTFTKDKITMKTADFKRIGYTIEGLQSDYTAEVSLASANSKLVDINISTSTTSIDIYSNATKGTTVASFTFKDSAGVVLIKDLQIVVTDAGVDPPTDAKLTDHTVKDPQACRDTSIWKKLVNSYSVGRREIDSLNSITFMSLSTATTNITLYYKDVVDTIQQRPDDGLDIRIAGVPRLDGKIESDKGFLIQTSKGFFNSGYYYVKIDDKCYRGEFPKSDSVKNYDIYRNVKLVVK